MMDRKKTFTVAAGILIASAILFPVSQSTEQQKKLFLQQLRVLKEKYVFSTWQADAGKTISGVTVGESLFPKLAQLRKVWPEDQVSIEEVEKIVFTKIKKWWRMGENEVEVTMVIGPTFTDVKNYLIRQYAETERQIPLIKSVGKENGINVGNVCFVSTEMRSREFSTIDFIRQNVLFQFRAAGSFRSELKPMVEHVDGLLLQKKAAGRLEQLSEQPKIESFTVQDARIKRGQKTLLNLKIGHVSQSPLHYFWTMTAGGVEKTFKDQFVYYGSEAGQQKITVHIVNDLGLYTSSSLDVNVLN